MIADPMGAGAGDPQAAAEAAGRAGDPLRLLEIVRDAGLGNARMAYLEVLALAQLGQTDRAIRRYAELGLAGQEDEDVLAVRGRLFKDLARRATGDAAGAALDIAGDAYAAAHRLSGGYFPQINAASIAMVAGRRAEAKTMAAAILARPDILRAEDYFAAATRGEAMLLMGDPAAAAQALADAVGRFRPDAGMRASTMRQIAWLARAMALPDAMTATLAAVLRPAPVLHYCGHIFDAGQPAERELAAAVADMIDGLGVVIAYGAPAAGADLLIAEAVLARGGEVHLVLPFAEADFLAVSVSPFGKEWERRYRSVRAGARSLISATHSAYVGDDGQFAYGSRIAMGLARLRATHLETTPVQLAVWNGAPGGVAGTAADIEHWRGLGEDARVIAPPPLTRRRPAVPGRARPAAPRALRAILFADFAGYSRLDETALAAFPQIVLAEAGRILDAQAGHVISRNSWGDAIFAIIDTPRRAAAIALALHDGLRPDLLAKAGLPTDGGLRISLHYGPVYEGHDPVRQASTAYGGEVTLAARIEPRVPVGAIYVTQPFAAILALEANDLDMDYVGIVSLPKSYGERPIYVLRAAAEAIAIPTGGRGAIG